MDHGICEFDIKRMTMKACKLTKKRSSADLEIGEVNK
jgi:hypothetical protein